MNSRSTVAAIVLGAALWAGCVSVDATSKKKGDKKNTQYVDTTTTNVEEVDELRGTLIRYTD